MGLTPVRRRPAARRLAALAILCLSLLGGAVPVPAGAQTVDPPSPASQGTVMLGLGHGRIFRFAEPVETAIIGDPHIADLRIVSPQLIYVFGSAVGTTNLLAVGAGNKQLGSIDLQVARDAATAKTAMQGLQPRSTVDLRFLGDHLVVTGAAHSVGEAIDDSMVAANAVPDAKEPIDRSSLAAATQINLRVRFAEVSRTSIRNLGINWQAMLNPGNFLVGLTTGSFLPGGANTTTNTFGTVTGGFHAGSTNIDVLLDALQREQALTMLAEPNLTTVSGQTASFLAGGEVPIPVPQGNQVVSIEYKPFGISLAFTPTLLDHDRIGIRVKPEVSSIVQNSTVTVNGFNAPTFSVRRAETTVELGSGQSFAIAGLFQHNVSDNLDKLPGVGDLPVLGALFRSSQYQRDESELVILITAYLVHPVAEPRLAEPTDRIDPLADATLNPRQQSLPGAGLAGFIIN
ncbi:MAG TPA: type II and III secretion system protein family protein [Aliidongia sp.]|uniref:type II and III secretion system protein family protein n=1 Tax=Aliidongia sp. TaxID=1914230 RepID=UPI002DDD546B|nr:type II and III secretion system protein family protein [Aliidongia sp.]HEV2676022.1 type II and III secretion system protein family protein [Aliidongia sp.]